MVRSSLKTYNAILAVIHLVLAIGFKMYFNNINANYPNTSAQGIELSVRNHTLNIAPNQVGTIVGTWKSTLTDTLQLSVVQNLLVGFFLVTAATHLYYFVQHDGNYSKMVNNGNNYVRWIEYSISSTMMIYIIALVSGVKDTNVYKSIFAMNIGMIYTGQVIEENIQAGKDWYLPMAVGFMLMISEFSIIIRDFNQRLNDVTEFTTNYPNLTNGRTIPSWLKYMIYVLFMFFASFGFISLYGAYSGTQFENIEKLYLLFSLLSKATLGGFIAYGTGQRQQNTPINQFPLLLPGTVSVSDGVISM
jgi:hypothetical protein